MQDLFLFWPALVAGLLVAATHVPLGIQVLDRGIVFIDLAVAQIAGLGVILGDWAGFAHHGAAMQLFAYGAALAGALLLNLTERLWPRVQEAIIGVAFILAANAAILVLAANPHAAEHLKDLLVGQILWVKAEQLSVLTAASAAILALALRWKSRAGFYVTFACAVTVSVQLVGIYLVFATLIVPALATLRMRRGRLAVCYALAAAGYASGLALSAATDLPTGPLVVCTMSALGAALFMCFGPSHGGHAEPG
jgi:zinc/manganese transport system permease protein